MEGGRDRAAVPILSQELLISRIIGFLYVGVAEILQECAEFFAVFQRDLKADQNTAVIGALVPIMEQGDVPVGRARGEEFEEGAGSFGEFKAEDSFVDCQFGVAADHITKVCFCQFVVGEVNCREAVFL